MARERTTTQLNKWEEELAKAAKEAQAALPTPSGNWISLHPRLAYNGTPIDGNALDVVILDFVRENQKYEGAYNPASPDTPLCYAFGNDDKTRAPTPTPRTRSPTFARTAPTTSGVAAARGRLATMSSALPWYPLTTSTLMWPTSRSAR